jgi:AcrR family transcriptional regulator
MGSDAKAARSLRADARRNRARVLQAAQAAFAAEGPSVPLDEIARRAGVGPGTVHRHFPTKEALFEAVVRSRLEALMDDARALAAADDPGAAFFGFLSRVADEGLQKRDLVEVLRAAGLDPTAATAGISNELRRAINQLLTRAQEAGAVRDDVSIAELMAVLAGISVAIQHYGGDAGLPARVLAIVSDGLRPGRA